MAGKAGKTGKTRKRKTAVKAKRSYTRRALRSQGELRTVENPLTAQMGVVITTLKNEALNAASAALDTALRAFTGGMPLRLVSGQAGAVTKRKYSKRVGAAPGRRQELIFPLMSALDAAEYGDKAVKVLAVINQHKATGISLTMLEAEIGWPYSTVQSHVNKLLDAKAIEKKKAAVAA
jgi:hypothetical protein